MDEYEAIIEFVGEQLGLYLKKDVEKILLSFLANDFLFHRNHFKKQIKYCQISKPSEFHFENVISLNKRYKD